MRVLVVGAGAVGAYYGARLAQAGHQVTLVARGLHGAAIARDGLRVRTPEGLLAVRVPVLARLEQGGSFEADVVLVAVKSPDLRAVAPGVAAACASDGLVVSLLNGLDSESELAEVVGRARVVGATALISAGRDRDGQTHVRAGGRVALAPLSSEQWPRVEHLAQIFAAAFPCQAHPSLCQILWHKLLWNAPFNGLCALTRLDAGHVVRDPALRELAMACMREVVAVACADGAELDEGDIHHMLDITRNEFPDTVPSMLQDVLAGRPLEVEALYGALVRRGRRHGVPTPVSSVLLALLGGLRPSAEG